MKRPYIILHMLTSIDGKVTGTFLGSDEAGKICEDYYRIHREYASNGFICGRITMEGSFTEGKRPDLSKYVGINIKRRDRVAKKADFYAVSIDPRGLVGWYGADIIDNDEGYNGAHVIEALTERASDEYIAYLNEKGVSYIFCGKDRVEPKTLCEKLYILFGIKKIMLEGGGKTDTAFLEDDLIDEISLVVCPMADCDADSVDLFSAKSSTSARALREFTLEDVKRLENNALWLNYKK